MFTWRLQKLRRTTTPPIRTFEVCQLVIAEPGRHVAINPFQIQPPVGYRALKELARSLGGA